jgi:hypothetical protein
VGKLAERQWHGGWWRTGRRARQRTNEAVVLEEDLSDEEAGSAGSVKWVVPAWEVLAPDRGGWGAGPGPG